jgi:hypothetical protein
MTERAAGPVIVWFRNEKQSTEIYFNIGYGRKAMADHFSWFCKAQESSLGEPGCVFMSDSS